MDNRSPQNVHALRGRTFAFRDDPFSAGPEAAVTCHEDGAVVIRGGVIEEVGPADQVLAARPGIEVTHYQGDLITAGFIDCHVHYPQTRVISSYGEQLLEWLEKYTFPAERAFDDPAHCALVADLFLDQCLRNGITSACSYCTIHPQSVDAFFERASARGLRMAAGKVLMDVHAPEWLTDTPQSAYADSKALIERWHGKGRNIYAVSPRFALTSSPAQLDAAATLWREHPTTLMQTHLSENTREIERAYTLYPDYADYAGIYEAHDLVGPGAIFGHCIHLDSRERAMLRDSGSAIAHCPTSNTFIGSGLFDLKGLKREAGIPVGLATDIGGGSSFSMFQTMKTAYEIAQLRGDTLHPACAFYLATMGSAEAMRLTGTIGNLAPGNEADIAVIDIASTPLIAERVGAAEDIFDVLFAQIGLADDRAIRAVYSGGTLVHQRGGQAASAEEKT
ncbi:MAG: guanine deaminase [Rhizobiales bacterium]|nr:guanine deaminase [Hyphomicrobiales bacterium]